MPMIKTPQVKNLGHQMVFLKNKPSLLQFSFNCHDLKREKSMVINNAMEVYTEHFKTDLKTEMF